MIAFNLASELTPQLLMSVDAWLIPLAAAMISLWDRAGLPLGLLGGLALSSSEGAQWLTLALCTTAGLIGDLACAALGHSLRRTQPTRSNTLTSSRSGLRGLVREYAVFVEPSPKLWGLASRLFPAINQWVMVALGVVGRPWRELILISALGNVALFGGAFALWRLSEASLSQLNPTLKVALPALGVALALLSLSIARRALPQHLKETA